MSDKTNDRDTKRRPLVTRRQALRIGAGGFIATVLATQTRHDGGHQDSSIPTLPESPFKAPESPVENINEHYENAYKRLEQSIEPAARELDAVSKKFGPLDALRPGVYKGCQVTLTPLPGHHEGACYFTMRDPGDKRTQNLPAMNRMIRACIDIRLLDERTEAPYDKALNLHNVAAKLVNAFKRIQPDSLIDSEFMQMEASHVLSGVVKEASAFERPDTGHGGKPPRDTSAAREVQFSLGSANIPLHFILKNPTIAENRDEVIVQTTSRGR